MLKFMPTGNCLKTATLNFGYNTVNLGLPPVTKPTKIELKVTAGDFSVKNTVTLNPVKKWKISFIQHSHTDIGYTRSQTEILAEHLRYIDYALDYCDATDNYPENAKFRWTCEASWPVDEYLKCRPQSQIDRLLKRIKEGRIEVTGMYFNFDEIPDEKILAASLEAVGRIKEKGIPVKLAMQNDVNGIGWCMNDYFNQLGIKYLNMGTHGHRALICFDKPTMFWWESPSGQRILTFRAEHYMTGNTVLEMQSGDLNRFKRREPAPPPPHASRPTGKTPGSRARSSARPAAARESASRTDTVCVMSGDQQDGCHQPRADRDEQMRIAHQVMRRVAAPALVVQQVDVAEHAVHHERHGVDQVGRAVDAYGVGIHGVQAVAQDHAGGGDAYHLVQQHRAVMFQHFAMGRLVFGQRNNFRAPLGKAEKQRHHQAAQQQPLRRRYADPERAGKYAQHETGGNDEHIQNHHMLEPQRVGDVHHRIASQDGQHHRRSAICQHQTGARPARREHAAAEMPTRP